MSIQVQSFVAAMNEKRHPPFVTGTPHPASPLSSPPLSPHSPILTAIAASRLRTAGMLRGITSDLTQDGTTPAAVVPPSNDHRIAAHIRTHQATVEAHRPIPHYRNANIESLVRESKHRDEVLFMQRYAAGLRASNSLHSLAGLGANPLLPPSAMLASRLAMQCLLSAPRLSNPAASARSDVLVPPERSPKPPSSKPPPSKTNNKTAVVKVLAMDCDRDSLSEYQCLIRQHMELFEATADDSVRNVQGRNKPVMVGQVGIRCRHCAVAGNTQASLYFPTKLDRVYQAAQNLSAFHLCQDCPHLPAKARHEMLVLKERKSPAGGGKRYWAEGVQCLGVKQVDGGLFFDKSCR